MKGLDFWATDAWTDSERPIFDDWSIKFMLQEWSCELMRDELKFLLGDAAARTAKDDHGI